MYDVGLSSILFYLCEMEASSKCPTGWAYYRDDGSEGADSCLQISSFVVSTWAQASISCTSTAVPSAHLLTVKSSTTSSGILAFATSLFSGNAFFIGCSQSSGATQRAAGWSWVDSTSASNLNCGTGNGAEGCGIWDTNEPK